MIPIKFPCYNKDESILYDWLIKDFFEFSEDLFKLDSLFDFLFTFKDGSEQALDHIRQCIRYASYSSTKFSIPDNILGSIIRNLNTYKENVANIDVDIEDFNSYILDMLKELITIDTNAFQRIYKEVRENEFSKDEKLSMLLDCQTVDSFDTVYSTLFIQNEKLSHLLINSGHILIKKLLSSFNHKYKKDTVTHIIANHLSDPTW